MRRSTILKSILLLCALVAGSSSVWAQTTIWSEDFTGAKADEAITAPTNSSYTGVTYTCTNGTGTTDKPGGSTIVKDENTGGGTKPELMVGKKGGGDAATGGKFTAVIPLDNYAGTLTLTYYQNKQKLKVSSTTAGVSGGQDLKPTSVGQQTTTFTGITTSMTSITIVFEATATSNVRLDNIVLTGTKVTGIAAPTISPNGSEDISATHSCNVSLSCDDDDVTIYYTTDGSNPQTSETKKEYTAPFTVSGYKTTVKAVSKKGDDFSSVTTAVFKDPSIQLLNFTINLNNAFFGTSYTGADAKGSGPHSNTDYGTTVTFTSGGDSKDFYISDTEIRAYSGNTLKFDAPSGYAFTKMTFASSWNSTTTIEGGGSFNSGRTIWTNAAGSSSVTFAPGGKTTITTIEIELTANVPITPSKAMTTFCTTCPLNFIGSELKAYAVSSVGTAAVLEEVTNIPVGTGLILVGTKDTQYDIPVGTATTLDKTNKLVGVMAATEISKNTASNEYDYVLSDGKFVRSANGTLPAGKAYLPASAVAGAPSLDIVFDGDNGSDNTTGIENLTPILSESEGAVYNLNGQRVAQPTKGLYIVNGRKVIVK